METVQTLTHLGDKMSACERQEADVAAVTWCSGWAKHRESGELLH